MNRPKLKEFRMYSYKAILAAAESRLVIYDSLVIVCTCFRGINF